MSGAGTLYGVGVGPGDPELLTLKALGVIGRAPVIAYPQLSETPSFARAIVAPHLGAPKREIVVRVPLGDRAATAAAYDAGAAEIAAALADGTDVATLCEGDPFLYGSFIALWRRLKDRFAYEIIPGITSITAAAGRLGQPLANGEETVAVVPATLDDSVLSERIAAADTAVLIKVGRHLGRLKRLIDGLGLTDQALYIERATLDNERRLPLAEVTDDQAPYFSIIVIAHAERGAP